MEVYVFRFIELTDLYGLKLQEGKRTERLLFEMYQVLFCMLYYVTLINNKRHHW